ncbi:MAG: DUF2461 domain-containing protein [Mariprofundaceae bacterium]
MSDFFTEDSFEFLQLLSENNNRDWFNAHKSDYEGLIREPALDFIRAVRPKLAGFAPHFLAEDKKVGGSLRRVYRDARFAKNKAPYKTNIGIQFRHEAAKDVHTPSFYLHIEAQEVFVGVGIWHPDADALRKIRGYIDAHPKDWQEALAGKYFAQSFQLAGDSLKRAPKGYPLDHSMIEDLKRKDFIALAPLMPELILQDDLVGLISSYFETAMPLMQQLCRAIGVKY